MTDTASKPTGARQDDALRDRFIPLPAMQLMAKASGSKQGTKKVPPANLGNNMRQDRSRAALHGTSQANL